MTDQWDAASDNGISAVPVPGGWAISGFCSNAQAYVPDPHAPHVQEAERARMKGAVCGGCHWSDFGGGRMRCGRSAAANGVGPRWSACHHYLPAADEGADE